MPACFKMLIRIAKQKTFDMGEETYLFSTIISKGTLKPEQQERKQVKKKKTVYAENTNISVFS